MRNERYEVSSKGSGVTKFWLLGCIYLTNASGSDLKSISQM